MDKIGNLKREKKVFRSRVIFSVVIMLSMTLILTLRLFNLQITKHDYYVEEVVRIYLSYASSRKTPRKVLLERTSS